jgi:hypothetical protein
MDGRLVGGMGAMYLRYGEAVDEADLADRLAVYPGGAKKMLGVASGWHELYRWPVTRAVGEAVLGVYNKRRTTRKLPPWSDD